MGDSKTFGIPEAKGLIYFTDYMTLWLQLIHYNENIPYMYIQRETISSHEVDVVVLLVDMATCVILSYHFTNQRVQYFLNLPNWKVAQVIILGVFIISVGEIAQFERRKRMGNFWDTIGFQYCAHAQIYAKKKKTAKSAATYCHKVSNCDISPSLI